MRHLVSVVVAPILGVIVYVLLGVGLARGGGADSWTQDHIIALAAVLGAGAAYAALLLPRWSPLGLVPVGLGYLGLTVWAYSDATSFRDIMPTDLLGSDFAGWLPAVPMTALLGVPLVATVVSGRRWRRYPHPIAPPLAPAYPPPPPPGEAPVAGGHPGSGGYPGYGHPSTTVPLTYSDPISVPPYGSPPPPPSYPALNPDQTQRL